MIPVAVVLVVVVALIVVKVATGAGGPKSGVAASAAAAAVVTTTTSVPLSAFDSVGVGTVTDFPVSAGSAPALTLNGLPRVFYAGAEYCPFCSTERWAVVVAMSRFGTWSGLGQTRSSPGDQYPRTATFTFHGGGHDPITVRCASFDNRSRPRRHQIIRDPPHIRRHPLAFRVKQNHAAQP